MAKHCNQINVRIDNRLLHGQVVQFWIPYLKVNHLVIADDLAASNTAMVSVYRVAVPRNINLSVVSVCELGLLTRMCAEDTSCLIVLSDIFDLARAQMNGFNISAITLGNVHSARGRKRITDAVYLSREELDALITLTDQRIKVEIQTFPGDARVLSHNPATGAIQWHKY